MSAELPRSFLDHDDDFSAGSPHAAASSPTPSRVLRSLTHCVIEVLAGARDLDQLARWVTDDVHRNLSKRVVLAARARRVKGQAPQRPAFTVGPVLHQRARRRHARGRRHGAPGSTAASRRHPP